ncbi:unnamed protein product, partial [Rhizoctonia solani]
MTSTVDPDWLPEEESPIDEPNMQRFEVPLEEELMGIRVLTSIQSISESFSLEQLNSDRDAGYEVIEPVLHVVLSFALDPATIIHLSEPRIVSGCMKLLKMIKNRRGTIFPTSSENGWLCFKLLVIALDLCLVKRYSKLEETMALLKQRFNTRTPPHIMVSARLTHELYAEFDAMQAGKDCDWVFGWSTSPGKPRQTLLLSEPETLDLMSMIWEDRKLYLHAIHSCVVRPGFCGLMFLFFRCLVRMRLQPSANLKILESRFYELAVRYLLVTGKYQSVIIQNMCDVEAKSFLSIGARAPRHVDAEDSRLILTAFIQRLTTGDNPELLRGREPGTMLRLVVFAIDTGAQSLIPRVIQCIVEYGWSLLSRIEGELGKFGELIAAIFQAL